MPRTTLPAYTNYPEVEATDPPPSPHPSRPRNHIAIAQLSSALNISLGLKRAVDARAISAVVRSLVRCSCCNHVRVWPALPFVGVVPCQPDAPDVALRNCGCGSTLGREMA